jgi:CRISPR-associated endonuclease Csn1
LRIVVDGTTRALNEAERRIALPCPTSRPAISPTSNCAPLDQGRTVSGAFKFAGLAIRPAGNRTDAKAKDPETEKLVKLPAWQELRKTLKDKGLETEWE